MMSDTSDKITTIPALQVDSAAGPQTIHGVGVGLLPAPSALLQEILGPSQAMQRLTVEVERVAQCNFSVIIMGETGSGKEVIARAIHQASRNGCGPFVPVDCGAIPESLLEDELFGHEKGSFTGASAQQVGKIEAARGGTLFLDEISNLPMSSQAKFLRALQEKTFCRIGSNRPLKVETRLLAASNQDLRQLTECGRFRLDLYFRLSEFIIHIPPLRERRDDILYLARHFADLTTRELQKPVTGFSDPAIEALLTYSWPGNVRELRSCVRRAVLMADGQIAEKHLCFSLQRGKGKAAPETEQEQEAELPLKEIVRRHIVKVERQVIRRVLRRTGGNKAKAARLLHIDYKTMHTKVREYGIDLQEERDL